MTLHRVISTRRKKPLVDGKDSYQLTHTERRYPPRHPQNISNSSVKPDLQTETYILFIANHAVPKGMTPIEIATANDSHCYSMDSFRTVK